MAQINNPFPHFIEATHAASRLWNAQRDLMILTAELTAKREAKRGALLTSTLILLKVTTLLTLFWGTYALREAGWPSWLLAVVSLVLFGGAAMTCGVFAFRLGKKPTPIEKSEKAP